MKKPSLLFFLTLILTILATILFFWKIIFIKSPSSTPPSSLPTFSPSPSSLFYLSPTPEVTPLPKGKGDSPKEIIDSLKEKFPLIEELPYETKDFSIDYIAPLHLQVKIKKTTDKTLSKIKIEVLEWIDSEGVDPFTHQIDWILPEP